MQKKFIKFGLVLVFCLFLKNGFDYSFGDTGHLISTIALSSHGDSGSKSIYDVLKEPLPPEDLVCEERENTIVVQGPTFNYVVDKNTGAISDIKVMREGSVVIKMTEPLNVLIDDESLVNNMRGETAVEVKEKNQVVLLTKGKWGSDISCSIRTTIYNDGVVVSQFVLTPESDKSLLQGIRQELSACGHFSHYLHKRRDTYGFDCYQGEIPKVGETARVYTPTSCLEVYSNKSALAIFTDMGDYYRSPQELDTGAVRVDSNQDDNVSVHIHQHIIHVGEKGNPYILKAETPFTFRIGLAVAPNRLPHLRRHDLRMFIWIGDEKYPYPTDEEIWTVAQLGYTLFQMHRLGPPGEPRPPAEELDRVIKTVHDAGMLFIWTANADLQYAHASEVVRRMKEGSWAEWEGFNYGGRYTATMDPFCDLVATCLASPNGLADYRMECNRRMMERYPVDGMYIDDNLAYSNCKRWKEHNHPQEVYDCLIELHDVNWRRRETLKEKIPHVVLIEHCSKAFILPVIAPFDVHLFGEGYDFSSVEEFRVTFGSFENMYGQGCLYAGDDESQRCPAESAYTFDLLTGGGQYCSIDWRLWSQKFPYATGVHLAEVLYIKAYNLMQFYFGMYETEPWLELKTSITGTYSVLYHNRVWDDYLIILANRTGDKQDCTLIDLKDHIPQDEHYIFYDIHQRNAVSLQKNQIQKVFTEVPLEPYQMKSFYVRPISSDEPNHLWGGKRISELWDNESSTLTVKLDAPLRLEDWVIFNKGKRTIDKITVDGKPTDFYYDPAKDLIFGKITYTARPVVISLHTIPTNNIKDSAMSLPEEKLPPLELKE
ncbi:MAG: hypothetical protein LDL53_03665 [Candidatus Hydrogenedens sp.]|nr:hypothetical protein [Candidatus Hydrogenedens sp.]